MTDYSGSLSQDLTLKTITYHCTKRCAHACTHWPGKHPHNRPLTDDKTCETITAHTHTQHYKLNLNNSYNELVKLIHPGYKRNSTLSSAFHPQSTGYLSLNSLISWMIPSLLVKWRASTDRREVRVNATTFESALAR